MSFKISESDHEEMIFHHWISYNIVPNKNFSTIVNSKINFDYSSKLNVYLCVAQIVVKKISGVALIQIS